MSIDNLNRKFEITVGAYNEGEPTQTDGGLTGITKGDSIELRILLMNIPGERETRDDTGRRFQEKSIVFQVSKKELDKKEFELKTGKTILEHEDEIYRVIKVKDYSMYKYTKSYQCTAVRMISLDAY